MHLSFDHDRNNKTHSVIGPNISRILQRKILNQMPHLNPATKYTHKETTSISQKMVNAILFPK